MQARHSAAEVRMPPSSCLVSEVLKTSQSTFHSETDTRNNSWGRKGIQSFALGKKVIPLWKNKLFKRCSQYVYGYSELSIDAHLNVPVVRTFHSTAGPVASQLFFKTTLWLKVIPQTLSTLYSQDHNVPTTTDQSILGNPHNLHHRQSRPLI